ncbi:kelch-like protein 5 isoform X2 [Dendronephthya gigantea]|nr:kelch-like protein 5 isoform X2 [Dendronephthya gigantea]XP_028414533.1 kelch-like protein 5 isoform X2 [Dendronephthya gigantea]
MKRNQDEMKQSMNQMREQFERIMMMMNQTFQRNNTNKKGASAMNHTTPVNNQDVIIIGGRCGPGSDELLNTVEKYNIVQGKSTLLPRLNHPRILSGSCVYNNDVLVVGGFDGKEETDTFEVLKMNQHPLRWTMFDGKLPVKLSGHDVIVYQGKLYIIGGYDGNERKTSNAIYEIALTPHYTAKLLTRMPEPKKNHRAELVNGKLFILGGTTSGLCKDALDSVVVYDFIKNEFKPCPSLPQPVFAMSTVTWGHMIIVVGGLNKNGQVLNDVIMYDTETGQSESLPCMIHKRCGSSVVIMNDVIVVFGGWNKEQGYLNSVESFTIGGDGWKELPGMIEKRYYATAVVKPV